MTVSISVDNAVAAITIDDGGKNVINHAVLDELEAAWERAQADDVQAFLLSGRPGSFCAGYDISVMTGNDPNASKELGRRGGKLAYQLFARAKPLVGLSAGHAFTIGALWLACCDIRIGEQGRFKYGMTEVALNVPFSDWPLEPLKARLDSRHLIPAILHSRVYSPEEALNAGFIDELVPTGEGLSAAMAAAMELAQLPQPAYGKSKQTLRKDALAVMAADLGL